MTNPMASRDRARAFLATRERERGPRVAKLCRVCRTPVDRMMDGGDDWTHEWPDCPFLVELAAAYRAGMSIRAIVAMAADDYHNRPARRRAPDGWEGWAGWLGEPTYNLVRKRLEWAGVLRNRGPRKLIDSLIG